MILETRNSGTEVWTQRLVMAVILVLFFGHLFFG